MTTRQDTKIRKRI